MRVVAGNAPNGGRKASSRRGLAWASAAAMLLVGLGGCGEGEPTEVPIAAVPLGEPGGQCIDVFQAAFADAPGKICLYFEGAPCVLVADLEAASTAGCEGEGDCNLQQGAWMKYCPEGSRGYDLETEAGQSVPATLYIVSEGMPGERPSFCTFEPPTGACDGSTDDGQSTNGCLARIDLQYVVDELDGTLRPNPDTPVNLTYSGFVQEEMGLWEGTDPVCPSIPGGACPPEAPSCTSVDLELLIQGSGAGRLRTVPRGDVCDQERCQTAYPRGRVVSISATAEPGAVLTSFAAALGAEQGCNEAFVATTTTATCSVTLTGSGQVTAKFGYELVVGVNGLGQVTGSPGGIDGDAIDCAGNQSCSEIYDADLAVTLTANETETDWQFSQWMGGPCDGSPSRTCTVQMDQGQTVSALFGYALSLDIEGDGVITATPPGQSCTGADAPCVVTFGSGASTTLTVSAGPGSVFAGWGGDCADQSTNTTCTLNMDQERSVVARFAYEIQSRADGGGSLTRSPPGQACGSLGTDVCGAYQAGAGVTFDAVASENWTFLEWDGCNASPGALQCALTVSRALAVRASFGRRLDLAFAGRGSVTLPPAVHGDCGINSSVDCFGAYADQEALTLVATPDPGWAVEADSWSGCTPVPGSPEQCRVTMSAPRSVGIVFGRQLDIAISGGGQVTSTPIGIDCGTDCTEVYNNGARITLQATADAGWAFEGWTGCEVDAQDPTQCGVTMSTAQSVTASFGRALQVNVAGGGVVQSTPGGIACSDAGGACSATFPNSTAVTLDATPAAGWAFLAWAGCTPDAVIPTRCTTTLDQGRTVTATFGRQMTVSTTGMGNVLTVNPAVGINCPSDCDEVYADGSSVTVRANPTGGWALVGWQGCSSINGNECTVTMNQARSISATFGRQLDVSITGGGQVISNPAGVNCVTGNVGDCNEAYISGTTVTLDATPTGGWGFMSWTGCTPVTGVPTRCTVAMNAAASVTAAFGRVLTVSTSGNGTVTSNPAGINCGADCDEVYADGTTITLTATPGGATAFGGWTGCNSTAGTSCTVNLVAPRSVTASFGSGVTVVIADGQGSVQSTPPGISCPGDCNQVFNTNQSVRLDATPAAGWVVRDWAGCTQDGGNPNRCTLTASGAGQTVTVRFGRQLNTSVVGGGTITAAGINCGADCDEVYANNTVVTLTATPDAGWAFLSWGGCTPVGGAPEQCTTTMSAARTVSATFGRQLDITINGQGATSSNPVGVSCGAGCEVHTDNTTVTITASPNAGWTLQSWSGCTPQANPLQCNVVMTVQRAVTVSFGRQMDVTVNGNGTVSSNPAGINCGADCSEVFNDGQNVTLTAIPTAGYELDVWSGCTPVGGNPNQCTTAMTAARAITATFFPTLTVNSPTAQAGETITSAPVGVSCVGPNCSDTGRFATNTAIRLTATPGTNRVTQWTGCAVVVGNEDQCDVTLNVPRTVTTTFVDTFPLTLTFTGTGTGSVNLSQVSREGTSACVADCTVRYIDGTSVNINAIPDGNSTFNSFSGDCTGAACSVNMDQARNVTATFDPQGT